MGGVQGVVLLNGQLLLESEARIAPSDRGFLLGDGLFETVRCVQGHLFQWEVHWQRLQAGGELLRLPLPWSQGTLREEIEQVLAANGCASRDALVRITLTRGPGPRGLLPPAATTPTWLITVHPFLQEVSPPWHAVLVRTVRNERSRLAACKTLQYGDNLLARQEALDAGAEEAILCNTLGELAGASCANLFLVLRGELLTPPISSGALPGTIRAAVLGCAQALGIPCAERPLPPALLHEAEELFVTNVRIGIQPLGSLEIAGRGVTFQAPGRATQRLQQAYTSLLYRSMVR